MHVASFSDWFSHAPAIPRSSLFSSAAFFFSPGVVWLKIARPLLHSRFVTFWIDLFVRPSNSLTSMPWNFKGSRIIWSFQIIINPIDFVYRISIYQKARYFIFRQNSHLCFWSQNYLSIVILKGRCATNLSFWFISHLSCHFRWFRGHFWIFGSKAPQLVSTACAKSGFGDFTFRTLKCLFFRSKFT